jgi:hypothetical protein
MLLFQHLTLPIRVSISREQVWVLTANGVSAVGIYQDTVKGSTVLALCSLLLPERVKLLIAEDFTIFRTSDDNRR